MNPILRKIAKPFWDKYQVGISKFPISKKAGNFLVCNSFPESISNYKNLSKPSLKNIGWQLVTENQFHEEEYKYWIKKLNVEFSLNRKQWEWVYILNGLNKLGVLNDKSRGIGFGCGNEPLVSVFASMGIRVTATDLDIVEAQNKGWVEGKMYSRNIDELNRFGICNQDDFNKLVEFKSCDMNHIPSSFSGYDFLWSSCALEHLGSLEAGIEFIEDSLKCLKPGGIAIHTTEFNLGCEDKTLEKGPVVLYRMKDILKLAHRLVESNHEIYPISFDYGGSEIDKHVDLPPYNMLKHIKLIYRRYLTSSFGIIIRKSFS